MCKVMDLRIRASKLDCPSVGSLLSPHWQSRIASMVTQAIHSSHQSGCRRCYPLNDDMVPSAHRASNHTDMQDKHCVDCYDIHPIQRLICHSLLGSSEWRDVCHELRLLATICNYLELLATIRNYLPSFAISLQLIYQSFNYWQPLFATKH